MIVLFLCMTDLFNTIEKQASATYKDKGSKFIAHAIPVQTENDIKEYIKNFRKEYYNARHVCYAWALGANRDKVRANDDGEPSSTAGKPILGQIQKYNLTNILIIIVRYFGGVLLGTSGLINAYRTATALALDECNIIEELVYVDFTVEFNYSLMNDVMKVFKNENLPQNNSTFDLKCLIQSKVRENRSEYVLATLNKIEGIKIQVL